MTEKTITDNNIPFGVGCFNFRYAVPVPFTFKVVHYVEALKATLEKLHNLSALEIDYEEDSDDQFFEITQLPETLEEGEAFPSPRSMIIEFHLYIPKRVQDELIKRSANTQAERFKVTLWHWYFGPVAFVECMEAGEDCSPSTAVQVVREFLEREIDKLDTPIAFESLGPSPFHMNFFALHVPTQSEEVLTKETRLQGYDRLDISFRDPDSLLWSVYFELLSELDLYYQLIRQNRLRAAEWGQLADQWQELRKQTDIEVPIYNFTKRLAVHRSARKLIADAFTFAVEDKFSEMARAQVMADEYGKGLEERFKRYVDRVVEQDPYPVQSVIDWATHVYESSFKTAEILMLVISATVGGIVGAAITGALSK